MPDIIKDRKVVNDPWQWISDLEATLPEGPVIVPLARWQQEREALLSRGDVTVCLPSDTGPEAILDDLPKLSLIAIDFPSFADGRGFSYARELRQRHGFSGDIRAVGGFMRDQLNYLERCGFSSYALRDSDLESALDSFDDFTESYQADVQQSKPLFMRR